MKNKVFIIIFCMFMVFSNSAKAICLDYWLKGPAACNETDEKGKKQIIIKGLKNGQIVNIEKDEERIKYEEDLDKKIDAFLANYGKPPREFVAFHLDPTLENAVRWVKQFNTEFERNMKIAVAWRQADQLFREYRDTGELTLPPEVQLTEKEKKYLLKAFEEDASDLPEVKGFGVPLPNNMDQNRLSRNYAKLNYKDEDYAKAASKLAKTGDGSDFSLKALQAKLKEDKKQADNVKKFALDENGQKVKQTQKANPNYPLSVSYYFSKDCKFCDKYHTELTQAIKNIGSDNISVTCVDMSNGSGKSPQNIKGKVDCKWRPLTTGETKQYGVKKTPTLLVKRANASALELLEGYHKADVLTKYFENGAD